MDIKGKILCSREDLLPPVSEIRKVASENGAFINFPKDTVNLDKMINFLRMELSGFTVFENAGSKTEDSITILPVLSQKDFLDHKEQFLKAIHEYDRMCRKLLTEHNERTLKGWKSNRHGNHIWFKHKKTGQTVEAPLDPDRQSMDPYFLAVFIKSSEPFTEIAGLIKHDFHDGIRIIRYAEEYGS